MSNPILGPEEQKRLVDGLLSQVSEFRSDLTGHVVTFLGTRYGGSVLKDGLESCRYVVKKFFLNDYERSYIHGIGDQIASAVERALKK